MIRRNVTQLFKQAPQHPRSHLFPNPLSLRATKPCRYGDRARIQSPQFLRVDNLTGIGIIPQIQGNRGGRLRARRIVLVSRMMSNACSRRRSAHDLSGPSKETEFVADVADAICAARIGPNDMASRKPRFMP